MVVIVYDDEAKANFRNAIGYIKKDSPQNAEKVKHEVASAIRSLLQNPQKHPLDKFRNNNDGRYRAFEIHNFRISYCVDEETIKIVRFRHIKMQPKNY